MRVVPRRPLTAADYAALDKPAVQRQRAVGDGLHAAAPNPKMCWIFRRFCGARRTE